MTYTSADLAAEVRAVQEEHPDYTPDQIARALETTVPLREVGKILLGPYVRDVLRRERNAAMTAAASPKAKAPAPRPTGRTGKMAQARDEWERLMDSRIYVPGDVDAWIAVRECNVHDLHAVAEARREAADALRAEGARYDRLAAALLDHQVATVGDLPREVGLAALAPV